jgi:hypothetical protein
MDFAGVLARPSGSLGGLHIFPQGQLVRCVDRANHANAPLLQLIPRLVSAYTIVHATTLSFVTLALINLVLPFDFWLLNPVAPSYAVDGSLLCRDIDAGFGWDEEWLEKCSTTFVLVKFVIACLGLILMVAQWWALFSVRGWGQELGKQSRVMGEVDVEKAGLVRGEDDATYDEKTGF